MTKIVALSGKKQSGKNTSANFLFGLSMWSILDEETKEPLIDYFKIDDKGRLIIPVDFGPEKGGVQPGIFDPASREQAVQIFLSNFVWPHVKLYSFADAVKNICINVLGLKDEQCYGTDEQKNTPTNIRWKDVPGFPANKPLEKLQKLGFNLGEDWTPEALMTARHVMQYVGTDIFRKMYPDVWVDTTMRNIQNEGSELAIITDCRFPNEVQGIQKAGGVVLRLKRAPFAGKDEHASETQLDPEVFDWSRFNDVISNEDMTIEQQNEAVFNSLVKLGVLEPNVE